ncbi:hypothetical protein ABT072_13765 [Streptomyces sp. NPDC002589]|uniref:hypothetical protein n=1 Tax=Streptomyces sp. NPDC002589 TaxID=3154420 RepID=UPI0033345E22
MTFPAALLGTAVRMLRTAAGRRALQLALLVGGLFALGFLCGEQAHAAEGVPLPAKATSARPAVTGHEDPVGAVTKQVVAPVHQVGDQAVAPVRDAVTTVSRSLEVSAGRAAERPRTSAPALPLPGLGQVPDVPEQLTPEAHSAASGPQRHGDARTFAPAEQKQRHAGGRAHAQAARTAAGASAPGAWSGPEITSVPQPMAHTSARRGTPLGVPDRPAPTGDPGGVLGKQAADGTTSRHGDAYAVAFDDRAPLRLAPGATARVDAPRTRERHRDIPVFPG